MFRLKAQLCSKFWLLRLSIPGVDFCFSFPPWFLIPFCSRASHHVAGDWGAEVIMTTDPWAPGWLQQHLLPLYFLFLSTSDLALLLICHLAATLHSTSSPRGQGWGLTRNGSCLGWHGRNSGYGAARSAGWPWLPGLCLEIQEVAFLCAPPLNSSHLDYFTVKDMQLLKELW